MTGKTIPNYRLYGEDSTQADVEFVHCESISQRSVIHDWNIRPHRHDTLYQLFHIGAGGGRMLLEGTPVDLPVPGLIVIPPMVVHGFEFQRDIEGWVVTIDDRAMQAILAIAPGLLSDLAAPAIVTPEEGGSVDFAEIARLFQRIADEFFGQEAGRLCALQSCLGLVFIQLARAVVSETRRRLSVADKRLEQAHRFRDLVERRFREHAPVAAYAADLGITPTHLNRVCRGLLGKSALEIVHDRVLLEARRQLIYTSMSVKEVSNVLGFSDPGYFTRFFTRNAKLSPSAFRVAMRAAQHSRPELAIMPRSARRPAVAAHNMN